MRAQIELPLNLFDEVGAAVRLQAIAELAAGVRVGVGLSLGDFLALAGENSRGGDIGLRLLRIFIEESELKIGFFAKAALSAQAYANLVVTGTATGDRIAGIPPGFTIAAGAGAGLEAGAGFQLFGTAKIASFSRLVARSADAVVDETVHRLAHALPNTASNARAALFGYAPHSRSPYVSRSNSANSSRPRRWGTTPPVRKVSPCGDCRSSSKNCSAQSAKLPCEPPCRACKPSSRRSTWSLRPGTTAGQSGTRSPINSRRPGTRSPARRHRTAG